jgi:hypothetical protein
MYNLQNYNLISPNFNKSAVGQIKRQTENSST